MNVSSKPRKRAVRLTSEAQATLRRGLNDHWRPGDSRGRLTRESRAEILGVSVATAAKILAGDGVDRATLALAFRNLGLAWEDGFCERLPDETEPVFEDPAADSPNGVDPVAGSAPQKWRPRWWPGPAAFLIGLALMSGWSVAGFRETDFSPVSKVWEKEFARQMEDGRSLYLGAHYDAAQKQVDQAFSLARKHDSLNGMAFATHVRGEIAAARGHLREAQTSYDHELHLRKTENPDSPKPVIHEALGDVETRLGDYASAGTHLTLALEGYRNLRDPAGVASTQRDFGSLALRKGELDEADAWLRQSLKCLQGLNRPGIEADVRGRQALVLLARDHAPQARDTLQNCLAYWKAENHPRWIALTEMHLGLAEAQLGQTASARARIVRSRDAFAKVGDEARIAEAQAHLVRLAPTTP